MLQNRIWLSTLMLAAAVASPAWALTVDGDPSDWGVVVGDNNTSTYNLSPGIGLVGAHEEDTDDLAGHDFLVGPNLGGQDYDGELLAVAYQDQKLFVSIVTGQRPDNGFAYYGPGDLRIITDQNTYGIEFGGGIGGGDGSALTEGMTGSTYTLRPNGETKVYADADAQQVTGSIWKNVNWILDPMEPFGPVQFDLSSGGDYVGLADFIYTRDTVTTQHAIIELSIDAELLLGETITSVHWRPSCGNDDQDVYGQVYIPEPATLLFLGLGSLGLMRRRRVV